MLAGYAVLVVLTLTVVSFVMVGLYRVNRLSHDIAAVVVPAQAAAGKMNDAVLAQSVYEKRYLVSRRKDFRHLFWERAREFDALLADLKQLGRRNQFPLASLERLHAHYGDLFLSMTENVRSGKIKAAEAISNGEMNVAVGSMLELLRAVHLQTVASRDAQMKMIDISISRALKTTLALCSISMIFSILAALLVTACISLPLRGLMTSVDHVAEGRFDGASGIQAGDEIGDLASSFDAMRVRLKKLEEMYRDASPLTRLPGGMAIEHQLQNSLDRKEPIALCVMDIDNFKSFNDRYGYAHGNMVIKETAKIVEQATRMFGKRTDFVGHIGGDDFVVITGPDSMDAVCTEIIRQFDQIAPHFYNDEDRRKGYLLGKTRQGVEMKFPLVTISIAIVTNRQRRFDNPLGISEAAAELKDYAKTFPQSLYVVDKRRTESVYR
jgi:diguanylate cyclase (GGDEF)-like protein